MLGRYRGHLLRTNPTVQGLSAIRYEEATDEVRKLLDKVIADHFGELRNAKIAALFDTKKHVTGGQVMLGNITYR